MRPQGRVAWIPHCPPWRGFLCREAVAQVMARPLAATLCLTQAAHSLLLPENTVARHRFCISLQASGTLCVFCPPAPGTPTQGPALHPSVPRPPLTHLRAPPSPQVEVELTFPPTFTLLAPLALPGWVGTLHFTPHAGRLAHSLLASTLRGRYESWPHCTDDKTKAQRSELDCLNSADW